MGDHSPALKKVLIVEHLISFAHALQIVTKLKVRRHAHVGYYYELVDLGMSIHDIRLRDKLPHLFDHRSGTMKTFGDYTGAVQGFHLRVFRDIA